MENEGPCLVSFPLWMKTVCRLGFAAMAVAGVLAAFRAGMAQGILTGGGMLILLAGIVHSLCRRCPYPHEHGDCLFFPAPLLARVLPRRPGPMDARDKGIFLGGLCLFMLLPLPWLLGNPLLLGVFAGLGVLQGVLFLARVCPRCLHGSCPVNRMCARRG